MPLEHVKIATVVRRLGLTSGAAYRIWTRQEDFHRDLALRVTRTTEGPAADAVSAATLAAMESGAPFEEVARLGALAQYNDTTSGNNLFYVGLALTAAGRNDDELREVNAHRYLESLADFALLYEAVLRHYGRRPRSPWTYPMVARVLAALSEGSALQADLPSVPDSEGLSHDPGELFAEAVVALAVNLTEPTTDARDK